MSKTIEERIAVLQDKAVQYQKNISIEKNSGEVARLQGEFSTCIVQEMQALIADGANSRDIQRVQELLRSAFEPMPNSYAADVSDETENDEYSEEDLIDYETHTYFVPVEYSLINDFEAGRISRDDFIGRLAEIESLVVEEVLDIVDLVIHNYNSDESIVGGNVIVGSDNEALVVNPVTLKNESGAQSVICDPTVFQNVDEAREIGQRLANLSEKGFSKRFDIKKLLDTGVFSGCNRQEVKKAADSILEVSLEVFKALHCFYKAATENSQCVLIMTV